MPFQWKSVTPRIEVSPQDWRDWRWQFRHSLKNSQDFSTHFDLTEDEQLAFEKSRHIFRAQTTPYYAAIAPGQDIYHPVRKILMPQPQEMEESAGQQMLDPLGERKPQNRKASRLIHRYSDRVLFLVTDLCSVYCRYCTRKHFTAQDQAKLNEQELEESLDYIRSHPGVREVIFSGGDPLTLSNSILERLISEVRAISHIEVIRVHTRMPVVCPMRIDSELVQIFKKNKPVYLVTHFNHPKEITAEAVEAIDLLVDGGVPVLNQMVLLNGINNHAAIVQALSRRLLYLRVKPYYMFQCDPSMGTDHLRTSLEDSLAIQKELWGHLSGLAMPTYIVDLPQGGGKVALTPECHLQTDQPGQWSFVGWDGVAATYVDPQLTVQPMDAEEYFEEWDRLKRAKEIF